MSNKLGKQIKELRRALNLITESEDLQKGIIRLPSAEVQKIMKERVQTDEQSQQDRLGKFNEDVDTDESNTEDSMMELDFKPGIKDRDPQLLDKLNYKLATHKKNSAEG